jgi:hypothetical protein
MCFEVVLFSANVFIAQDYETTKIWQRVFLMVAMLIPISSSTMFSINTIGEV